MTIIILFIGKLTQHPYFGTQTLEASRSRKAGWPERQLPETTEFAVHLDKNTKHALHEDQCVKADVILETSCPLLTRLVGLYVPSVNSGVVFNYQEHYNRHT